MENQVILLRAKELYRNVVESFSYKKTDADTETVSIYPVSYSEIRTALKKIAEIEDLKITDQDFKFQLEGLKTVCTKSLKKKFKPSIPMLISVLIWLAMNLFFAFNNITTKLQDYYKIDSADSIYTSDLKMHLSQIEHYKSRPLDEDSQKWITKHNEQLEALKNITPQQYIDQKNQEIRNKEYKNIIRAGFAIIMFLLYLLSVRTPMFLVYKARKERERALEKNLSASFISSAIAGIMSIPPEKGGEGEVEIKMSDGTVRKEKRYEWGVDLRPFFIGIFLALTFYALLVLLPVIIIYKYLRNYQYKFFDQLFSSSNKKRNEPESEIILKKNNNKKTLPKITELRTGDTIFARYSADQYFYYGTVDALNEERAMISFYDGVKEEVLISNLCNIEYALQSLEVEANWKNKGLYYNCKIIKSKSKGYEVLYNDGSKENVSIDQLRFS